MDETVETLLLRRMVEQRSLSGSEGELAAQLTPELAGLGFTSHVDAAGNVVGEAGAADGPVIMLLGHIDTVGGEVAVRREEDLLYGRGTVDAKGPFATMIWAAARVAAHIPARLVLIGAVDEEGESRGARHLIDGYRPDAVIIGEPSGVDTVVLGYKGVFRFDYEVHCAPTHSSSAEDKATERTLDFVEGVRSLLREAGGERYFDRALPTVVRMDGDMECARATMSCRLPVGFDTAGFSAALRQLAGDASITVLEQVPAVRSSRADPVVRALTGAVRRHRGRVETKVKLGTSDMNVVTPHWSAPVAAYGPGDSRLDHTADEHIDLREYLASIDILADALVDIAATVTRPDDKE